MDSWAAHELALPTVPTPYFTTPYDLRPAQLVTAQLRKELTALPASVTEVDMLVCDSAPRRAGDFSLWFSLRYAVAQIDVNGDIAETPEEIVYRRVEPNLLDTGFTFMYYPPPVNFTNEFVTGGPLQGGTQVVIEGSGFTKGYRNESDIDLSQLIVRWPPSLLTPHLPPPASRVPRPASRLPPPSPFPPPPPPTPPPSSHPATRCAVASPTSLRSSTSASPCPQRSATTSPASLAPSATPPSSPSPSTLTPTGPSSTSASARAFSLTLALLH